MLSCCCVGASGCLDVGEECDRCTGLLCAGCGWPLLANWHRCVYPMVYTSTVLSTV